MFLKKKKGETKEEKKNSPVLYKSENREETQNEEKKNTRCYNDVNGGDASVLTIVFLVSSSSIET